MKTTKIESFRLGERGLQIIKLKNPRTKATVDSPVWPSPITIDGIKYLYAFSPETLEGGLKHAEERYKLPHLFKPVKDQFDRIAIYKHRILKSERETLEVRGKK